MRVIFGSHCHLLCSIPQIVDVNLTSEGKVKLEVGMTLSFTYQVCTHNHIDVHVQA